ncbi:hypothetical protein BC828DRAFT_419041 [Blastocladiella britannica]|nr:hypothetical protein BC828DRAFT_419041 [Blastocladiella britannica]
MLAYPTHLIHPDAPIRSRKTPRSTTTKSAAGSGGGSSSGGDSGNDDPLHDAKRIANTISARRARARKAAKLGFLEASKYDLHFEYPKSDEETLLTGAELVSPDFESWARRSDELTATNPKRIAEALENFISGLSLASLAAEVSVTFSHCAAESDDAFFADLAVGLGIKYVKTGAPCRSEHLDKFNQLLRDDRQPAASGAGNAAASAASMSRLEAAQSVAHLAEMEAKRPAARARQQGQRKGQQKRKTSAIPHGPTVGPSSAASSSTAPPAQYQSAANHSQSSTSRAPPPMNA